MQRQRGELVPIGEVIADLPGPGPGAHTLSLERNTISPLADQVDQLVGASEAEPDRGFHGANDGAVFPAAKQPRQPASVQAGEWSVQVDLESDRASTSYPTVPTRA